MYALTREGVVYDVRGDTRPVHPAAGVWVPCPPEVRAGWTWDGETFAAPAAPDADIETIRSAALVQVDRQAEAARQAWLTAGSGQALEYEATRREATTAAADPADPLDPAAYPHLEAERLALDAVGEVVTLRAVAEQVAAEAAAWTAASAAIKAVRRGAKLRIAAAADEAAIAAIVSGLSWPAP